MGPTPGPETPEQPDEVDEVDAGDVVEGIGVVGLASGSSRVTGCGVICGRSFLSQFTISHSMPTIGQSNPMSRPGCESGGCLFRHMLIVNRQRSKHSTEYLASFFRLDFDSPARARRARLWSTP